MKIRKSLLAVTITSLSLFAGSVSAAVSEEEAKQLGTTLTPMGAEMAGNAEGTIPAWNPNFKTPASYKKGDRYVDPYADEKPLFTITAENMEQYKDKLTPGMQAMFKNYPDTSKMPVYPSHRDARYSDYNIEQTRKNATRTTLSEDQNSVVNAVGGAPFPIPQSGAEVVWNIGLAKSAYSTYKQVQQVVTYRNGSQLVGGQNRYDYYAYHDPDSEVGQFDSSKNPILYTLIESTAPTRDKGKSYLVHEFMDRSTKARAAWSYTPGVRRVRRAPTISFDTPQGLANWRTTDESFGFNGSLEKYNWTLVGKQEMYIPYNNNKFENADVEMSELLTPGHANPEFMRYELHRVWVVKAKLKEGERNIFKTRVLYIDEDTWIAAAVDQFDNRDNLWRTSMGLSANLYDVQGVFPRTFFYHDLVSREYFADELYNYTKPALYNEQPKAISYFSPGTLRKLGVR
ncbi:DUF1329 domain-containing protein [Endozoicomonas montiporae]|uniref:Outer membrane lipoprotein-sorting protein n=1 Tax=Endozoicomonas montiporae CL-33 TaxID=570277 RepID=A0A142BJ11_9GAMM|nr:DUF1329 domain-containing protein [Endozoicomonas montiporae]AMO58737.1 hypothetical protein EZMO1_4842 [Endozoicomonas montiporae CL-33]